MIELTFYNKVTGEIVSNYSGIQHENIFTGKEDYGVLNGIYEGDKFYVQNGVIVKIPLAPSEAHRFNFSTKQWEVSPERLEAERLFLKEKLNLHRIWLEKQPISVTEGSFDADDTAIKNIQGKLQEIALKEGLGLEVDFLIWRSADNVNVSFEDVAAYKDFLSRLVIAISARTTSLYQVAWLKKAGIDALASIEDILSYDVTVGW